MGLRNACELKAPEYANRHKSANSRLRRQHSLPSINLWLAPLGALRPLWASLSLNRSDVPWRFIAILHQLSLPRVDCKTNTGKRNWIEFLGKNLARVHLRGCARDQSSRWRQGRLLPSGPRLLVRPAVRLPLRADLEALCTLVIGFK